MDVKILIIISLVILLSYAFDLITKKIKLPSIFLLLLTGIILQLICKYFQINIPFIDKTLPSLGTVGLILIVLEGAMDLTLTKEKKTIIQKAFFSSLFILIFISFSIALGIHLYFEVPFLHALVNAVPFAIISSAVAIPSAHALEAAHKEYVIYESTFSDILGIIFFNFIAFSEHINIAHGFLEIWHLVLMLIIAITITLVLIVFIDKIQHHVKFLPIVSFLILVYALGKFMHLSPLILIFTFGLLLNNHHLFTKTYLKRFFTTTKLESDIALFKHITAETVFIVKTLFFIIFGFTANMQEFSNLSSVAIAGVIFLILLMIRFIYLAITHKKAIEPLVYYAPRGLITILLFLSIPEKFKLDFISNGVVLMVVLLTIIFLVIGNLRTKKSIEPATQE